jgi:hypothetical protein
MAIQLSGSLAITGSLVATSQIVAQTLNVQQVTSSIVYSSGSNIFGNSLSNTQIMTGSVSITGSLSVNGTSSTLGTGTTNYLPKFTGTSTIGNSIVSESGSIISVIANSAGLRVTESGGADVRMVAGGSTGFFGTYSNHSLQFLTNSGTKLTLDPSGNLGLGVTPSAWVDYTGFQIGTQGSIGATSTVINFSQNVYYGSSGNSYIANGNAAMYQMNDGVHGWRIAGSGTAGNAITFTQAMTLDASGRLGIGTTSPAYKLHIVTDAVAGRQNMSSISRTTGNWVRFTNPQYSADASMGLILRVFPDSDTRQGAGIIASGGSNNATTDLDLFVTTSPDGTGGTSYSALKINGLNGNVGIGTTSPSYKLDVTGTARTTDNTVLASSGNYVSIGGAPFYAGTSVGSLSIRGDLYPGIAFYTGSAGGDLVGQIFSYAGTGNIILNADPNNSNSSTTIQFHVDDSFKMLINASGNVGIGTTSPNSRLDVRISDATTYTTGSAGNTLTLYNTSTTTNAFVGIDFIGEPTSGNAGRAGINMITVGSGASDLAFSTRGSSVLAERMRITSGGLINMGTTSAYTSRLNVQSTSPSVAAIKAGYGGIAGNGYTVLADNYTLTESLMSIGIDYSSGGLVLGSIMAPSTTTQGAFISTQAQFGSFGSAIRLSTSGEILFYRGTQDSVISTGNAKAATVSLFINNGGNVGINNTNPLSRLHIGAAIDTSGDAPNALTIKQTSTNETTGIYLERSGERKGYYIYVGGSLDSLNFQRNNSGTKVDTMTLTRDGNVGIGTTSPSSPLHVARDVIYHITVEQTSTNTSKTDAYATFYVINNAGSSQLRGFFGAGGNGVGNSAMQNYIYYGAQSNHGVRFFTNDSVKMTLEAGGNILPGANGTQNLGSDSLRWATVFTSDLSLSNGIGDYTIVEGENDLFLYNNKQNKVYKFVIEEVDPSIATPKKS